MLMFDVLLFSWWLTILVDTDLIGVLPEFSWIMEVVLEYDQIFHSLSVHFTRDSLFHAKLFPKS